MHSRSDSSLPSPTTFAGPTATLSALIHSLFFSFLPHSLFSGDGASSHPLVLSPLPPAAPFPLSFLSRCCRAAASSPGRARGDIGWAKRRRWSGAAGGAARWSRAERRSWAEVARPEAPRGSGAFFFHFLILDVKVFLKKFPNLFILDEKNLQNF